MAPACHTLFALSLCSSVPGRRVPLTVGISGLLCVWSFPRSSRVIPSGWKTSLQSQRLIIVVLCGVSKMQNSEVWLDFQGETIMILIKITECVSYGHDSNVGS